MNILLLSTIYPLPSSQNKGTAVCHYFAKEWVAMGHNVNVIHYQAIYPFFFYWIARIAGQYIASKTGAIVYDRPDKGEKYVQDGVNIFRIPLLKYFPHGKFRQSGIDDSIKQIISYNKESDFLPDIIVGHFPNPQIEVVARLKDIYPKARTAIIMHGEINVPQKIYGEQLKSLFFKIDSWGFRSKTIKENFYAIYGGNKKSFICYSGVPGTYITVRNKHLFENKLKNFIYVGSLIKRKYPAIILDALVDIYPDKDFCLNYIGVGKEDKAIKKKIHRYHVEGQVRLSGHMRREEIKDEYDAADCMIMVSRNEAYGLVYLEAMARGCIVIASKREGIDGVIEDGKNGFLCNAGDVNALVNTIHRINMLSPAERYIISNNAINTAKKLSDKNVAKMYLDDVIDD